MNGVCLWTPGSPALLLAVGLHKQVRHKMFYAQKADGCLTQLFACTSSGSRAPQRGECVTN